MSLSCIARLRAIHLVIARQCQLRKNQMMRGSCAARRLRPIQQRKNDCGACGRADAGGDYENQRCPHEVRSESKIAPFGIEIASVTHRDLRANKNHPLFCWSLAKLMAYDELDPNGQAQVAAFRTVELIHPFNLARCFTPRVLRAMPRLAVLVSNDRR